MSVDSCDFSTPAPTYRSLAAAQAGSRRTQVELSLEPGQRVGLPSGIPGWVTVDMATAAADGGWTLCVIDEYGDLHHG